MLASPWGELAVNDAHVHFFSRRFFDLLSAQKGSSIDDAARTSGFELPAADPVDLARRWVTELDSHGVDAAALIASLPGDEESVAAAIRAFPARFQGYFMTNPKAPGALERSENAFAQGLRGICFFPAMHGYSMADEVAGPLLALAERNRGVVFIHCGVLSVGIRGKLGLASAFDLRYSRPESMQAAALKHPGAKFVIPHFGAGYLREALMVASLCPNVYLDTSSTNRWMRFDGLDLAGVFQRTLDVVGPGRVVFGSDSSFFPRGWVGQVFRDQVEALHRVGVDEKAARQIFGGNFTDLFNIT